MAGEHKCVKKMTSEEHIKYALSKEPSLDTFLDTVFGVIRRETDFYRKYDQKTGEAIITSYVAKYGTCCVCGDKPKQEIVAAMTADTECTQRPSNSEQMSMTEQMNSTKNAAVSGASSTTASASRMTIDDLVDVRVNNDYNGATCQSYSWSQAINEIDVIVPIASIVTSSRQVKVFIRSDDLTVLVNVAGNWVHKVNGRLCHTIRPMNSVWTLHPSSHIHISLEKERERWWNALIDGEQQLGVGSKDRSVQFDHLTHDAQAMVQKLAFEQYLKCKHRANS